MSKRASAAVAAVAVLAIVVGMAPGVEAKKKKKLPPAPTFRVERTYYTCADDLKLQNIPAAQGTYPSWDTTAPSEGVMDGAGCGQYENLLTADPFKLVYEGTFVGNLNSMTVELYAIDFGSSRATNTYPLDFTVSVDGTEVFFSDFYQMPVEYVNSSITSKMTFSLSGLNYRSEPGNGVTERTIRLDIESYNEMQTLWVWETSEVPAGITFNPTSLEPTAFTVPPPAA